MNKMMSRVERRRKEREARKFSKKNNQKRVVTLTMAMSFVMNGITTFASTKENGEEIKRDLPVYFQGGDNAWAWTGYSSNVMATDGCGPTSMAMIVQGLKGEWEDINVDSEYGINDAFDPYDAAIFSRNIGAEDPYAGTNQYVLFPQLAEKAGLKYENTLDMNVAYEALKNGSAVIANERWVNESGEMCGHFFVLSNLTEDGRVVVNDPFAYGSWERANFRHNNPMAMEDIDSYIGSGTGYHIFTNENMPEETNEEVLTESESEKESVTEFEETNPDDVQIDESQSEEVNVDEPKEEVVKIGSLIFVDDSAVEETVEEPKEEVIKIGSLVFENNESKSLDMNTYKYLNIAESMESYKANRTSSAVYSDQEVELILTSLNLFARMEKINPYMAMELMFAKTNNFSYEGIQYDKNDYNFFGLTDKKGNQIKYESLTEGVKSYVQYLKRLTTEDKLVLEAKNNDAIKDVKTPGKVKNAADLSKVTGLTREKIDSIIEASKR